MISANYGDLRTVYNLIKYPVTKSKMPPEHNFEQTVFVSLILYIAFDNIKAGNVLVSDLFSI